MKRKLILCLALSAVLLFTCTAQAAAVIPPVDVSKSNSEFNIQLSQTAAQTSSEIPKEQFGGSYIKDGVVYINIVQEYYPDYSQASSRKNGCKITYQPVKFSLEYLEDIMYRMIPYMAQYQICTIDADDVNNTINLEVIEDTNELRQFVQDFIDLKHVKITVTSSYPFAC